jgi:hypothetical protein
MERRFTDCSVIARLLSLRGTRVHNHQEEPEHKTCNHKAYAAVKEEKYGHMTGLTYETKQKEARKN